MLMKRFLLTLGVKTANFQESGDKQNEGRSLLALYTLLYKSGWRGWTVYLDSGAWPYLIPGK